LFDDAVVENKRNWEAVIEQCVEFVCYPTVLMFEKVNGNDEFKSSCNLNPK